jgi:DNA-binding IclR family transcriptional regulator
MARSIQSLERAAAVLRLLAGGERRLGLSDIASSVGLAKATAHGLLRTLQQEGFVEQDAQSGKYQLGAELLRLGNSYLDVHELRARALGWTGDLARASGESAYLGVLHQRGVLIVHHVFRPDDSRQALEVGGLLPAHASAIGKALLAENVYVLTGLAEAGLTRFTAATITDADELRAHLSETTERGWAADIEELVEGEASYAATIKDRRGLAVGAIGISGPVERLLRDGGPRSDFVSYVREAARAVSRDFGALPW